MPFQESVTIINNSGKVISTGKQLFSIFKEAKAAYKDKKDAVRAERAAAPGIHRARTFDLSPGGDWSPPQQHYEFDDYMVEQPSRPQIEGRRDRSNADEDRRRSVDDVRSTASSRRSHRSRRTSSRQHGSGSQARPPPLTESNLRTLSEVSSTAPSVDPRAHERTAYRSPYAETAPRDMALSRPTLAYAPTMPMPATAAHPGGAPTATELTASTAVSTPRQSMLVHRVRSDPSLRHRSKQIDLNLAYGPVPPDLGSRTDLDHYLAPESPAQREAHARTLMQRVEALLVEAQCVQHTASHIIKHLQATPEAAAAVALTLAELSSLLGKMSPAFLGVIKGGFPAVFALLASPQFLIASGLAFGVVVVSFGGWKIVKRMRAAKREKEEGMAAVGAMPAQGAAGFQRGAAFAAGAGEMGGFDEALVLEEEDDLSLIESWRRGIVPYGEDETVDVELISPEAQRSMLARRREETEAGGGDAATERSARTGTGTERTRKPRKAHSHSHSRSHKHHRRQGDGEVDEDVPERKSSRGFKERKEDERTGTPSKRGGGDGRDTDARSERSRSTKHTSASKRPERVELKAIEEGSRASDVTLDTVLRPKEREKKGNMLKQLFKKKKEREDTERDRSVVSTTRP